MRSKLSLRASVFLATAACVVPAAQALTFKPVPAANLDLSQLGRIAVAGDFDAISVFQYYGQNENGTTSQGSHSLLSRYPSGVFATLLASDAYISSMCSIMKDGKVEGVVIGGNFTSLGEIEASGLALFNPTTNTVQPISGLKGKVQAVYCDTSSNNVYVGGSFSAANSTNAVVYSTTQNFTNLPFGGFNGAVNSIIKGPNGNIIFGGSFDGLGNATTPQMRDSQVVPLGTGTITASTTSSQAGFDDPKNIICKTGDNGAGSTWLLADNAPGAWTATFQFGFNPTKLRLYNTNQDGRGTKTFRFTAIPINGIMNLTYSDPTSGETRYCDATCPLPEGNTTAQDFHFVNSIGMNGFRLDISDWYGSGAGLSGIELFQDDIYVFAVDRFNEPKCDSVSNGARATATGPWKESQSLASTSNYLSAQLSGDIDSSSASVVFQPDIKQSGNYSVMIYTPGCLQDNTCSSRGKVNITGGMASTTRTSAAPVSTELYQTNNFDKYDEIYLGYVEASSSNFRPSITIAPSAGQKGPLTFVAQRVRFFLRQSTGGLNGVFEWDPNSKTVDKDFSKSAIDAAAMSLNAGATVNSIAVQGKTLYVAGNLSSTGLSNVFSITDAARSLSEGGLNGEVKAMFQNGSALFMGGSFTGTLTGKTSGLQGFAAYDTATNGWVPLGAGVNGSVSYLVPFSLNLGGKKAETAIALTGWFNKVNGFGKFQELDVHNFAVWVPGRNNWLQNLNLPSISLQGMLTVGLDVPGNPPLFGGSVSSQALNANGAAQLSNSGKDINLQSFPVAVAPQASSSRKRAISADSTGVLTGEYYNKNNFNLTILGGQFTAKASNGSTVQNLAILNGSNKDEVTGFVSGINSGSTVRALGTQGSMLFVGGSVTGTIQGTKVSGMVVYDLSRMDYAQTQPPAFGGSNVSVNAIAPQPTGSNVFVGGNFKSASELDCPALCVYDTGRSQWNSPGNGLKGEVKSLNWVDNTHLLLAGTLSVNGNDSATVLYDSKAQKFTALGGPAGIAAATPGTSDGSQFWVSGKTADGGAMLEKWDGTHWKPAEPALGAGSEIKGLQIFTTNDKHDSSPLVDRNNVLLVLGHISLPAFGNCSAALFNGTAWTPFLLATKGNGAGSLAYVFAQNSNNFFKRGHHKLALGLIVLIGLAISLALLALIITAAVLAERYQRKRDGYLPAPTIIPADKNANMTRIPPEHLFDSVGPNRRSMGPAL
ncbi:cellular morphogenesis protein [Trichodelitschia bisporula]|uniref:Cellular morphogenesis protein n=1 Tax=Trichodelitschia bisporula TaxID=703511 RepID=A0A6G1I702_9PEZI|nr:cellular morphogenesis protein [Trichodelitschia bisporula]